MLTSHLHIVHAGERPTPRTVETAIDNLLTVISHPRSLARHEGDWRPPSLTLPAGPHRPALTVTVSKYRTGERVCTFMRHSGYQDQPAYLVTLRFSDASGAPVSPDDAQWWIDRLAFDTLGAPDGAVYSVTGESSPTYCWLVRGDYSPISSPVNVFSSLDQAA